MSHPFSRRELIFKALSLTGTQAMLSNPVSHLLTTILTGMATSAQAQALGAKPRKFLFLPFMGGPPRWTFTPFSPHSDDLSKFIPNPGINTRFTNATTMEYKTVKIGGIEWPWLWQFNVAKGGGGTRPMADLMKNMMIIRGIQAASAHGPAQVQRYYPLNIPYSFGSQVSDRSQAAIPAINYQANPYEHRSAAGKSFVSLPESGNLLTQLLDGLSMAPRSFHSLSKGSMKDLLKSVSLEMESQALGQSTGFLASSQSLKSAEEVIDRGFGDLGATWNGLANKYLDICTRTVNQTFPGINDQPIGSPVSSRDQRYQWAEKGVYLQNADLRTLITPTTRPRRMAESFALAEYVLLNGLSDNITLGIDTLINVNQQLASRTYTFGGYFDEHETGAFPSLIFNTFFNLCLGGCMLELIDRLKAANLFNEVLIDASGEMGRNPRGPTSASLVDRYGSGSDHGGEALDVAMWSGVLNSNPQIVGNVLREPPSSYRYTGLDGTVYPGSWGFGASNPGFGILTLGHLSATQAQILRVPNPVRSASSLVAETGGVFSPLIGMSRLV